MAKTDPTKPADAQLAEDTPPTPRERPRLGTLIDVKVAEGMQLINGETGTYFAAGVPTPQTVTITTLRRLDDGDLVLV
jgi:hypothetical protein